MPSDSSDIPPAMILYWITLVDGFSIASSLTIDCAGCSTMGFALFD